MLVLFSLLGAVHLGSDDNRLLRSLGFPMPTHEALRCDHVQARRWNFSASQRAAAQVPQLRRARSLQGERACMRLGLLKFVQAPLCSPRPPCARAGMHCPLTSPPAAFMHIRLCSSWICVNLQALCCWRRLPAVRMLLGIILDSRVEPVPGLGKGRCRMLLVPCVTLTIFSASQVSGPLSRNR